MPSIILCDSGTAKSPRKTSVKSNMDLNSFSEGFEKAKSNIFRRGIKKLLLVKGPTKILKIWYDDEAPEC